MRPDQPDFLLAARQRSRVSTALLLSLLLHALLLSLSLGGQGSGLPGLDLPWRERRLGADDLRVTLVPAPVRPATAALIEPPVAAPASPEPVAVTEPAVLSEQAPVSAPISAPGPAPKLMSLARSDAANWAVPVALTAPEAPAPVIIAAAVPSASSPEALLEVPRDVAEAAQKQIALVAAQEAKERAQERAQEVARLARAEQEAKQAKERQAEEAQMAAAARLEAQRQQAAAAQAATQAAAQATIRAELERAEAARVLAESERQEATRQEAAKLAAANLAKAALAAARAEQDAKREAARRAMGRQLDEEAARRDAAALAARQSPSSLLPSASSARRGRLFGRSDPNAELLLYAEAWSRKIELNQTFDMIRAAVKQPHTQPLVTVAVRSDGSIESVSFVRSSGVAEIDEGIRRILQSQAPFPPFQPALAREFDVIEIRRSWNFDTAIRLY